MEGRIIEENILDKIKKPLGFFNKIKKKIIIGDNKNEIAQEMISEGKFGKLYRLELVLSIIICTLWLLINSVPVIIGAMLIAPILLPIKTVAFSIATGNRHMYKTWLKFIFLSIIIWITIALLVSYLIPLTKLTPEIMSRTSPTIIDLYIALASGMIAFLSLGFKKLWESIAGVAMATALIPPLCVVWIGINIVNIEIAKGSFLLFITNMFAIILIGIIVFFVFGFFPTDNKWKKRTFWNIIITIITVIILSIPLTNSMKSISDDIYITKIIEQTTKDFVKGINENIEIENITYQNIETDKIRINAIINVPNTIVITQENKDNLSKVLAAAAKKSIDLNLNIASFSSVYIEKKAEPSIQEIIENAIITHMKTYTWIIIIETKLAHYSDTQLLYLNLFSEIPQDQNKIESEIKEIAKNKLWKNTVTIVLWHKDSEEKQWEIKESLVESWITQERYTTAIKSFVANNIENTYIEKIDITQINGTGNILHIDIRLSSSLDKNILEKKLINLKDILQTQFKKPLTMEIKTIFLSDITIK